MNGAGVHEKKEIIDTFLRMQRETELLQTQINKRAITLRKLLQESKKQLNF